MTTTRTHTNTYTHEEEAVLQAIKVRKSHRPGKWTLEQITDTVHDNHVSTHEAAAAGLNDHPLVDVVDELIPTIIDQLIARGWVKSNGGDPETYSVAR